MKRWMFWVVLGSFFLTPVPVLGADSAAHVKRDPEAEKKLAEERKKVEERKKDLNGTRWDVTVKPADPKESESRDVLTFQDHQMRSEYLEKKGYPATNYTITIPSAEGQSGVWETMKTGQDATAFLRGEWNKNVMSGSIHEQTKKGKETVTKAYYFSSEKRVAIAPISKTEGLSEPETFSGATDISKILKSTEKS